MHHLLCLQFSKYSCRIAHADGGPLTQVLANMMQQLWFITVLCGKVLHDAQIRRIYAFHNHDTSRLRIRGL